MMYDHEQLKNVYGDMPASFEQRIRLTLDNLPEEKPVRRLRIRWQSALAAAVMVMALAGSALATDLFGLGHLRVADPFAAATAAPTADPIATEPITSTQNSIALQGLPESPEFLATAEWMEFLSGYDRDRSLLNAVGDEPTGLEDKYGLYFVYTPEMADKLDEIVTRHGLQLHNSINFFDSAQELYSLSGTGAFLGSTSMHGYIYEDSSFLFSASSRLPDGAVFSYEFNRHMKGSFSEVTLNIGDADSYEQWEYTTDGGVTLHMFMGEDKCLILGDLEMAFVSVNILGGTAGGGTYMDEPVTKTSLEAFADTVDFSRLG